jgi:hypothetical protein
VEHPDGEAADSVRTIGAWVLGEFQSGSVNWGFAYKLGQEGEGIERVEGTDEPACCRV